METHIQVQGVPGQLGAQVIGSGPGYIFADIGYANGNPLLHQGDPDKEQRGVDKRLQSLAGQRRIDEISHDLGGKNAQANAAEQQGSQQYKASFLRTDVLGKQVPVGFEGEVHKKSCSTTIKNATVRECTVAYHTRIRPSAVSRRTSRRMFVVIKTDYD